MKMHDIELAELEMKCPAERRRPIESSDQGTRKISDLNAVKIYRGCDWSGSDARSIDVSGKDLQFVPFCCQCAAEAMDGKDWSPIAHGWQIARDDMEDAHAPPLTVDLDYPPVRAEERRVNRKAAVDAIFSRRLWFYSFRKQAAAAIVQQISAAVGQQVSSAARRDLAGRTRERRPLDNQPREPDCAAPPDNS